tara:strand:+ start:1450 stop:2340 length:891 start_codon:yes stop_codon:yes gene_type:complete
MIKLFVFFLVIINFSLKAEDNLLTLKQQVDRLQREVNDLSKIVFQNGIHENIDSSEQNNSTDLNNITAFDIRIYDLESDIKNIYSNYEDISFQIEELKNLIEEINIKLNTKIINQIENNNTQDVNSENIDDVESNNTLGTLKINSEDLSENSEKTEENDSIVANDQVKNLTPEEEYQLAFDLLRSQKFEEAKLALNEFIIKNENHNLAGTAVYYLGELHLLQKDYIEAALIFGDGYEKYRTKSVKAPDILYKLGLVFTKINKNLEACNSFKIFKREYSNHKLNEKINLKIQELECE